MPSTTIYKFPMPHPNNNKAFLKSSFTKAIAPLRTTAPSQAVVASATAALTTLLTTVISTPTSSALPQCNNRMSNNSTRSFRATTWATTFALLSITLLSYCSLLSSAAPAKHTPAPPSLVSSMQLTFSDTSPLPLQLQIESQVRGTQKLAYLPTTGPGLDFYYLNYRPTYIAGQSTIDFWMVSPMGAQAPKTASLELFDEFGKVRLATLVKEGTEVPRDVAAKGEPFLWKSWMVPKELKANFEFSDKFRVVLRTSDSTAAPATMNVGGKGKKTMSKKVVKNDKRSTSITSSLLNKIFKRAAPAPAKKAATTKPAGGFVVVQDRQFRIKGLKATPGGQVNPAKLNINSVALPPVNGNTNTNAKSKVKTSNPSTTITDNKDTGAAAPAPAANAPVVPLSNSKPSAGISSLTGINLFLTVTVTVLLCFLGLF
ncbi:hypothetical protein EC991_008537 [Linnemannia zychae]|nr:hypothetical protein EC991_008537 [Linnemannia zychae]